MELNMSRDSKNLLPFVKLGLPWCFFHELTYSMTCTNHDFSLPVLGIAQLDTTLTLIFGHYLSQVYLGFGSSRSCI